MKKSIFKIISLLVLMTFSMTSCLNDLEDFIGDFSSAPAIAELSESVNPSTGTIVREIIDPTLPADFKLMVNIAVANPLTTDTKVVLVQDNSLVDAYNAEKELTGAAAAIAIPASAIATSGYEVTIPAGKNEIEWEFSIDAAQVPDPVSTFYILAIRIESVTNGITISGNMGSKLIRILARNKYDGLYLLKGMHNRVPYIYPYETEMEMRTAGGSSVSFWWPEVSSPGHPIGIGPDNAMSWYGTAISPVVEFDPVTNLVTNVYNAGGSTVITKFTGAGANSNLYDPATKTIFVSWNYANNPLRAFFDTLTFISPR